MLLVWLLLVFLQLPEPEPPETFLVIDVGAPARAETPTLAPTVDEPAPTAETPRVADSQFGEPQATEAPSLEEAAPEVATETLQPEVPEAAPDAPEPVTVETPRPPIPDLATPTTLAPDVTPNPELVTPLPLANLPEIEPLRLQERLEVPMPTVATVLPEPRAIAPIPSATVAAQAEIPLPEVGVSLAQAAPIPLPTPTVGVTAARPVALPEVGVSVGAARDVSVIPDVQVAAARAVPVPAVAATVRPSPPAVASAVEAEGAEAATSENESVRDLDTVAGGDAAAPAQTGEPVEADLAAAGAAAAPDGARNPTGSPAIPAPFNLRLERPMAVLVDNTGTRAISGLREASQVLEMPVEGGFSRLMLSFDRQDPTLVGPVRSARDYFVTLAWRANSALVHMGGSPDALAMVEEASARPTLNLMFGRWDAVYQRVGGGAPYNAFLTDVVRVRGAVDAFNLTSPRAVSGIIYQPAAGTRRVSFVRTSFGGGFTSGFDYEPTLNRYRWLRNGAPEVDAAGEPVRVDAVLLGSVSVRVLDGEGRLGIALDGGPATLYLRGQAVDGRWVVRDGVGVSFVQADGTPVDLTPYQTWIVLTPDYAARFEVP
jgi:hypothetical protein